MGRNDYHVSDDGRLRPGLTNKNELKGVVAEMDDAVEAMELSMLLVKQAQTIKDRKLPMLKGTGFIVIDPANPRFDGEELADIEDARNHANNVAYKNGVAIIYAPITVMRPKREVAESTPSKLLQQLNLEQKPAPVAVIGGTKDVPEPKA